MSKTYLRDLPGLKDKQLPKRTTQDKQLHKGAAQDKKLLKLP